jgi:hypothetical protein
MSGQSWYKKSNVKHLRTEVNDLPVKDCWCLVHVGVALGRGWVLALHEKEH